MSGQVKWYDDRAELAAFLRHIVNRFGFSTREVIDVVREPWEQDDNFREFDLQREMRRQTDEQADIKRKNESMATA